MLLSYFGLRSTVFQSNGREPCVEKPTEQPSSTSREVHALPIGNRLSSATCSPFLLVDVFTDHLVSNGTRTDGEIASPPEMPAPDLFSQVRKLWVPKYRKAVRDQEGSDSCSRLLRQIAPEHELETVPGIERISLSASAQFGSRTGLTQIVSNDENDYAEIQVRRRVNEAPSLLWRSVDGFLARPDDALDFLNTGEQEPHELKKFLATVDVVVIGHRTLDVVLKLRHLARLTVWSC
jgi:hypothetical protein